MGLPSGWRLAAAILALALAGCGERPKLEPLASDAVVLHPNASGYRVIAERLAEQLKQSGAI